MNKSVALHRTSTQNEEALELPDPNNHHILYMTSYANEVINYIATVSVSKDSCSHSMAGIHVNSPIIKGLSLVPEKTALY